MFWKGQSAAVYSVPEVKDYLSMTNGGETMFLWAAEYNDGTVMTQFPLELFNKFQQDPDAVPALGLGISVSKLDVSKVKEFFLLPTAHAKKVLPWLTPYRLVINLAKGEKFISYRLCDRSTIMNQTGPLSTGKICRHVLGVSQYVNGAQAKTFTVISPSGLITLTSSEDISYEGE